MFNVKKHIKHILNKSVYSAFPLNKEFKVNVFWTNNNQNQTTVELAKPNLSEVHRIISKFNISINREKRKNSNKNFLETKYLIDYQTFLEELNISVSNLKHHKKLYERITSKTKDLTCDSPSIIHKNFFYKLGWTLPSSKEVSQEIIDNIHRNEVFSEVRIYQQVRRYIFIDYNILLFLYQLNILIYLRLLLFYNVNR